MIVYSMKRSVLVLLKIHPFFFTSTYPYYYFYWPADKPAAMQVSKML